MHFYGFNIESYVAHTRHLTPLEDIAYRRLLDLYYLHEKPLAGTVQEVARRAGLRDHVEEVEAVLAEFFEQTADGWRNGRADDEIRAYRSKCAKAKKAAQRSAEARSSSAAAEPTPSERPADAEPTPSERSTDAEPTLSERSTDAERTLNGGSAINPNPNPSTRGVQHPPPSNPKGIEPNPALPWPGGGDGGQPTLFALLCGSGIRSKSRNRRAVLSEIATDLDAQGLEPDQLRRLISKARQESNGDPWALLSSWLDKGTWRDKWAEIMGRKLARTTRGVAAARRA